MYRLLLLCVVMASFYIPSAASSALSKPLQGTNVVTKTNPYTSTAWIGSAITAGASLLGGLFDNKSQNKNINKQIRAQQEENQKNREYNLQLAQMQNAWNQEQWERENEYNSPTAQMERMRQAGLNPDLMMTGGTGSLAASSPQMTSGAPSSPQDMSILGQRPTLGQAVQSALRDSMLGAQIDNIRANTRKTLADAGISETQLEYEDARQLIGLDLMRVQFDKNKREWQILGEEVKKAQAEVSGVEADVAMKRIEAMFHDRKISAIVSDLENKADISKNEAEYLLKTLSLRIAGVKYDVSEKEYNEQFHYKLGEKMSDKILRELSPVIPYLRKMILGV